MAHSCDPFDITVKGNMAATLDQVRTAILQAGGKFTGDASAGSLSAPTPLGKIEGKYTVRGNVVTLTITNKPMLVSCDTIEGKVREYFK
jgi:hypothetical protein